MDGWDLREIDDKMGPGKSTGFLNYIIIDNFNDDKKT